MFAIGKAHNELGYTPEYDIARGVAEGVQWYLTAKNASSTVQEKRPVVQTEK